MRHLKYLLFVNSLWLFSCSQEADQNRVKQDKSHEKSRIVEPKIESQEVLVNLKDDTLKSPVNKIKPPIIDRDHQKPHGGKVIADQPKNYDSSEWKKIQYYDSINRIKK